MTAMTMAIGRYSWMKVMDVMTRDPITVAVWDTVGKVDELMSENRIRQLPVVNGRKLAGIVTDRDIRSFLSASVYDPDLREKALNVKVDSIMTTNPITLSTNDDLQTAVELLLEEKVGGIPVVDKPGGLVGIVTYVDLLRCFLNRLQED
jgi:acetoin utilization protein AcuB